MKTLIFIILLAVPFSSFAKDFHPEATPELENNQIWTNVYFKPNTDTAVMEFRVWFKHESDTVFETLTDTVSFKTKMSNYKDSRTLTKQIFKKIIDAKPTNPEGVVALIGNNQIASDYNRDKDHNWTDYLYFEFNFPWPLTNRWAVKKVNIDESNAAKGEYSFAYKMELGNFKNLFGKWELVPVPQHKGWTEFRGSYESDAGIPIPKFISKKAMKAGFKKDMEAYRRILKSK